MVQNKKIDKLTSFLVLILVFLLPTQLGHFFFIKDSYISGLKIDYLAPTIYLTDILIIVLVVLKLFDQLKLESLSISKNLKKSLFYFYLFFLVFIILNIITALSPIISMYKYIKVAEVIVVYWIFKNSKIAPKNILKAFFAGAVFQFLLVLGQIYSQSALQGVFYYFGERAFSISTSGIAKISLQGVEIMRGYGTFSHPNSLAGFYLLLYTYFLFLKPHPTLPAISYKLQAIKPLFLALCALLILFSFSKIAIIGLAILTIFWFFRTKTDCLICRLSHLVVPLILAFVFLSGQGDYQSLDKRIWLAESSLQIIQDNLLFGAGLGNYLIAQSQFSIPYPYFFLQPVHNISLLMMAELGIPLFSALLFLIIRFVIRNWPLAIRLLPILFVIIFTGFFDHYWLTLQQNMLLIPVVFGLLQRDKTVIK